MAEAPYQFIDPNWISLTAGTGTHFDDPTTTAHGLTDTHAHANAPNAFPRNAPFTPFLPPQQPPRSTYGPLRHQHRNPTFAPLRPASPRHSALDPRARPFAPPRPQEPSRLVVETKQETENRAAASAASPRTPVTPRIELSPADDVIGDAGVAAVQAVRQSSRMRRDSSPGRSPAGIQRRSSNASKRLPVRTGLPTSTPAPIRPPVPRFPPQGPVNNQESVRAWLVDGPFTAGFNGQPDSPQTGAQGSQATLNPSGPPRPGFARSTSSTTASTAVITATTASRNGPYYCSHPSCSTPGKPWPTPSALDKHARAHLPESSRPHGCRAENCHRRFWWPKDRIRHERRVHHGASVMCGVCGERLSREDNLVRHLTTVHREPEMSEAPEMLSPAMSMRTVRSEYAESLAAQTPQSEFEYTLTVPSSPPSIATPYYPYASGSAAKRPRHLSFALGQGPPPSFRMPSGPSGSHAMKKSQSSGW